MYKFYIKIHENKKNKKFAKALRNLNPKLIKELIKESVDPNTKFKGKSPLEIVYETCIGSHNSHQVEQVINILINNGTIITAQIYKKYKNRAENLEELIETGTFIDAADEDDEQEYIYDENHVDELEAIKVLVNAYDVAYKREMVKRKKAIKKAIRAKKGFEVGIGDIIGKMAINY